MTRPTLSVLALLAAAGLPLPAPAAPTGAAPPPAPRLAQAAPAPAPAQTPADAPEAAPEAPAADAPGEPLLPDAGAIPDALPTDGPPADLDGTPAAAAPKPEKRLPGPITHDLAGPYLAGRQAAIGNDFEAAASYYLRALAQDPREPFLIDSALVALISAGQTDRAASLAAELAGRGAATELTGVVNRVAAARAGDWPKLLSLLGGKGPDLGGAAQGGELLDGLLRAWAELGAGRASEAVKQLGTLSRIRGAAPMVNYNLALVKASVGDYEAAATLLAKPEVGAHLAGVLARAEVLAQLDRRDEALSVLEAAPGGGEEPAVVALSARLASGQPVPFTALTGAVDGIAQTLLTFATALAGGEEPDPLALVQSRLAAWLRPELAEARLMNAQLLQTDGQFELAEAEFAALRSLGEVRPVAELARIDALARAERLDDAEKAATALTAAHPDLAPAWVALGDILRQREKFVPAIPAYSRALALIEAADGEARWFPLYARGIARERSGDFPGAEQDMRAALKLRPDNPQILNYLGYSYIDRNERLDEAVGMIEKAAQLRPEDGFIQDSLGWGYYRLGRYAEAVAPMERAVERMSNDPLVNDHLGDVYWKAGRAREAEIQWRRALNLVLDAVPDESSTELAPDRLRAKIARGLDAVLADEAAGRPLAPTAEAEAGAKAPAATQGGG